MNKVHDTAAKLAAQVYELQRAAVRARDHLDEERPENAKKVLGDALTASGCPMSAMTVPKCVACAQPVYVEARGIYTTRGLTCGRECAMSEPPRMPTDEERARFVLTTLGHCNPVRIAWLAEEFRQARESALP